MPTGGPGREQRQRWEEGAAQSAQRGPPAGGLPALDLGSPPPSISQRCQGRGLAWGQGGQETWGSADSCGVLPDGLIPQTLPAVLRGSYALAKSVFRNEVSCSGMHTQMLGL